MIDLNLLFGLRLPNGVVMLDPTQLAPLDPDATWLENAVGEGRSQRQRLAAAAQDLERLRNGWLPTVDDLEAAPILDDWALYVIGNLSPVLVGTVVGHPILGGRRITTSVVIAVETKTLAWARTVSRFYQLGRMRGTELTS
jgi:hypothetical protein